MGLQTSYRCIRWILGDQLDLQHSWFQEQKDDVLYVIAELRQETDYVKHHIQKICGFFAAMEDFSRELTSSGHDVLHLTLDETSSYVSLDSLVESLLNIYGCSAFEYQLPDEFRLRQQFAAMEFGNDISVCSCESEHFLLNQEQLKHYFKADQRYQMEAFYRSMRRKYSILMHGNKPVGGEWNFDHANRNKLKKKDLSALPEPHLFSNNVESILARIQKHNIPHFGRPDDSLLWPINRRQSLDLLNEFCEKLLPNFGRFQDAMTQHTKQKWSLYHSRLSFALNCKILHPMEVIEAALKSLSDSEESDLLPQVEGFIRQILGWREFVRGIYWANMPSYSSKNYLQASQSLPEYFWTGNTKMQCMQQVINQSLNYAYAHHIQRLMITGNFCLLAGIHPDQVDAWYLGIYIDAIEWVELPNTRGMSQFADGGLLATKPYAASANYIHKMSDYCQNCVYDRQLKSEKNACPFNSLYWLFLDDNRTTLQSNPRLTMVYKGWDSRGDEYRQPILQRGRWVKSHLDQL